MFESTGLPSDLPRRCDAVASSTFAIEPHFGDRYIRITLIGLWNSVTLQRYRATLRLVTLQMTGRGGYRGALLDASDYPIQPMTIADGHADAMRIARSELGVRASVTMQGPRSRLQMARITDTTGHRLFDRPGDALCWLCS